MFTFLNSFRIFFITLFAVTLVVITKYIFHILGWELIEQSSLHNSVVSSVTFVIGFLLTATIADYKESERIPADFATNVEDMYNDVITIHASHPVFDLQKFRKQLFKVVVGFKEDARNHSYTARDDIRGLTTFYSAMERGKVPPNFIVKLKQQHTLLLKSHYRIHYIQRIKFIPSATILARSIVGMVIILLLFTNVDPFYGGLTIVGLISFVLIYMLVLINVISTPFHSAGKTRDDVSLFLVDDVENYLSKKTRGA